MNAVDKVLSYIAPKLAYKRLQYRQAIQAQYEGTQSGRLRTIGRERRGPIKSIERDVVPMREIARQYEQNYDIVVSIFNTLVANVVGPGISVEPQPKRLGSNEIHTEFAEELLRAWEDFKKHPEVTGEYDLGHAERMAALQWVRDGESFARHLRGNVAGLDHKTLVPYSFELLEADYCPNDFSEEKKNIVQGVQFGQWRQPVNYFFYGSHPGDGISSSSRLISVAAADVMHIKQARRVNQPRGISLIAPIINRIHDLKDYEESERVAARISAAMTMAIIKGLPEDFNNADGSGNRMFDIAPGMVFDDLRPGEDVKVLQSSRPSTLLTPFRDSMERAMAAGTGTGYSSISRNYSGTYSAQRQELVEQFAHYSINTAYFISRQSLPVYEVFVAMYLLARSRIVQGERSLPTDLDPLSLTDAAYRGPAMPWIDPEKEVNAQIKQVQAGFKSRSQVIRERSGNPEATYSEIIKERDRDYEDGMSFVSDYINLAQRGDFDLTPESEEETEQRDEENRDAA